jgi:hypothetical protein
MLAKEYDSSAIVGLRQKPDTKKAGLHRPLISLRPLAQRRTPRCNRLTGFAAAAATSACAFSSKSAE